MTLDARRLIPGHNVLLMTLDSLRFDVATTALARGATPNFAALLPGGHWEERHAPATFTYAAHHAMFAGFLPTPARPGKHPRLFAARFAGSETTAATTYVFDAPDIVTGLSDIGYHTICIGGVGFFNKQTPLSCVLPGLFHESWWSPAMGVTSRDSAEQQAACAIERLSLVPANKRTLLFMNMSACHQPSSIFVPDAVADSIETQIAALASVDRALPRLFTAMQQRGPWLAVLCSDHGTAFGEDGYFGHRLAHSVVWTVPYTEFVFGADQESR